MSENVEKDPMDVDIDEIDEEIDEFNDNEDGPISGMEAGDKLDSSAVAAQTLIPELPELTKKDKTLKEVLSMMDDYSPIIPDAVTNYLMAKNGLEINDLSIKRLLALATQKFVSDIAQDAYEYSRIRSNTVNKLKNTLNSGQPGNQQQLSGLNLTGAGNSSGAGANSGISASGGGASNANNEKLTLRVEDLSSALEEYGINIKRPNFYR